MTAPNILDIAPYRVAYVAINRNIEKTAEIYFELANGHAVAAYTAGEGVDGQGLGEEVTRCRTAMDFMLSGFSDSEKQNLRVSLEELRGRFKRNGEEVASAFVQDVLDKELAQQPAVA